MTKKLIISLHLGDVCGLLIIIEVIFISSSLSKNDSELGVVEGVNAPDPLLT